jgi:Protein of unknown function (DUF3147)
MADAIARFIVGGVFVSLFAVLGDVLQPKSFAGLFAAAPSVALATLLLAVDHEGASYCALEGRSMIVGAIAFCGYAYCVSYVSMRCKLSGSVSAGVFILVWLGIAMGLRVTCLR